MDSRHTATIYLPDLARFLATNLPTSDLHALVILIDENVAEWDFTAGLHEALWDTMQEGMDCE